jgi:hypothetical protein
MMPQQTIPPVNDVLVLDQELKSLDIQESVMNPIKTRKGTTLPSRQRSLINCLQVDPIRTRVSISIPTTPEAKDEISYTMRRPPNAVVRRLGNLKY